MTYRIAHHMNKFYALILLSGCIIYKTGLHTNFESAENEARWYIAAHSLSGIYAKV